MASLIRNSGAFARGEAYEKVYVERPRELRLLSLALNKLYDQLEDRIGTVNRQRDELAAILTGMVEAVVVLDNQLCIKTMNPAARRLFPFDRDPVGVSLIEVCRNSALDAFARGLLAEEDAPSRTEIVLRDQETTLQLQGALLRHDEGKRWGVVLVMVDITQLKRLEAMRRDFVSNVSHELKTPITNILGYVETLADGAIDNPQAARPFLETIQRHAGRLNLIVDDLLILTRLENSPPQEGEKRPVDLVELVPGALPLLEEKARGRRVTLETQLPPGPVTQSAYPVLLEQALVNLVDNAVKFSPEGSRVTVAVLSAPGADEIQVDDEGPGIAENEQKRIFERFYRTEKGRSTPGTGLGLAIVKHILHLHRGTVTVDSPVPGTGRGTRFTLRLPRE
jgi:two-component system phosphate regulon sensor histidine kinase PhoR